MADIVEERVDGKVVKVSARIDAIWLESRSFPLVALAAVRAVGLSALYAKGEVRVGADNVLVRNGEHYVYAELTADNDLLLSAAVYEDTAPVEMVTQYFPEFVDAVESKIRDHAHLAAAILDKVDNNCGFVNVLKQEVEKLKALVGDIPNGETAISLLQLQAAEIELLKGEIDNLKKLYEPFWDRLELLKYKVEDIIERPRWWQFWKWFATEKPSMSSLLAKGGEARIVSAWCGGCIFGSIDNEDDACDGCTIKTVPTYHVDAVVLATKPSRFQGVRL